MRLIVLVSDSGKSLAVLMRSIAIKQLNANIVLVISHHPDAFGLQHAQQSGIDTLYSPLKPYLDAHAGKAIEHYQQDLAQKIESYQPDLIVLDGWEYPLEKPFLERFPQQVMGFHLALPGEFPGADPIGRAYDAFQRGDILNSGVVIHYMEPETPAGKVLLKAGVPMLIEDTLEDFELRMYATQTQLLVKAIALHAAKRHSSNGN